MDSERTSTRKRETLPPEIEERILKIRRHWSALRQEWSSDELLDIHSALSELSEFAGHEGFNTLADAAFSAEVYLSSFVGTQMPMTPHQRESVDSLLAELTAEHPVDGENRERNAAAARTDQIFILGPWEEPLPTVADLLREQGHETVHLKEAAQIEEAIRETLPALIVTDVQSIPEIESLLEQLARLRETAGERVPMVYVSGADSLETRIHAIRAGGAAFFSPPFDSEDFSRKLDPLISREGLGKKRILIVEDDASQAEFAASIMNKAGFETSTVTDPMQTLEQLREFAPDLIVMDIYMPEVDGIELTSVIREYNDFASIPVIFLSGEQDTDRQIDALSVGGDDFVTKPIRPKHLIAIVKNRLRRTALLRQRVAISTGSTLLNKTQFVERLTTLLSTDPMRAQATAVLLLSPDHGEELKGEYGSEGYEQLVTRLAQLLDEQLGERDALARLDPTTLAIACRRTDANEINDLTTRLHESIASHNFRIRQANQSVTSGIGLAFASRNDNDANNLLSHAFAALQQALLKPRSQTVTYDGSPHGAAGAEGEARPSAEDDLTHTIRNCLEEDGFTILFQPLLDIQERGSENYEVMIRIPTARGDLLARDAFQETADKAGLAGEIDKCLIMHALQVLKERRAGAPDTRFFLRQSGAALMDPSFPAWLAEQLRKYQVVGTGLVLDYSLSSLSHDLKAAKVYANRLEKMDIAICISDFPEKSAAFKLLRFMHGSYIRIAKRLLKTDQKTIMSIVKEAHDAEAKVIISHIDDPRSIDLHWSSGGDLLQGDFIQPPIDNLDYDFSQVVI